MDGYNQKIIDILLKNKLTISSVEVGTDGLISSMLSLPSNSKETYTGGLVFNNIDTLEKHFSIKLEKADTVVNDVCILSCRRFKTDCSICSYKEDNDIYVGIALLDKVYVNKTNFDNRTLAAASSLVYLSNLLKGMDK